MPNSRKPFHMQQQPMQGGAPIAEIAALVGTGCLKGCMLVLLFGTYSETMGMMSNVYLCDLPGAGGIFCGIDDEMTVSHLLAFLLAVFSIAVPMAIWSEVISRGIYRDPKAWLSDPTNKIYAILALGVYGLVFALETVNLYTLIARQSVGGPFQTTDTNPMMEFLANNQGLGVFVAALVAIVNTVLGLLAVRAAYSLKTKLAR